ncbi:MAG TPA: TraB/GumN family protein [Chromatiales bacterium]|nr:TraB/GumN family protein [Chromatiales bacterium]
MRNRMRLMIVIATLLASWTPAAFGVPLWQLEGTRGQIVFLGSVHFLRDEDYPLPDSIQRAYKDADVLVMEMDMDDLNPVQSQATVLSLAQDPDGRDLKTLIGSRNYSIAKREADAIGIDMTTLMPFEPWFAALQITQIRLMQLGLDPNQGIESYLTAWAARDGKEIRGLESFETQLRALDTLPARAQAKFLLRTLEEAAEIETSIDTILSAWRRGDVQTLESELLKGLSGQPELYQQILVDRNRDWARKLAALASERKNYLVIVGTLHLVGKDSVLKMLDDAGYPSHRLPD